MTDVNTGPASPSPAAPVRAIGYARLSREGKDDSTSIKGQMAVLRDYAAAHDLDLVDVLVDDGLSGGSERANAVDALRRLQKGKVDLLLVDHADRWSRQGIRAVADLQDTLDELEARGRTGAGFVAVGQGLDSRVDGFDVMFGVSAVMARAERRAARRRQVRRQAEKRADGRYIGLSRPYGYASASNPRGEGTVLVPHPQQAAIVREGMALVLAGRSLTSIARTWNDRTLLSGPSLRGVPFGADYVSGRGRAWSVSSVKAVLTGHGILGRQTRRRPVEGTSRTVVEPVTGADGLPLTVWEPLVDLETWSRVRAALGVDLPPAERAPRRRAARLLSGLLTCAVCRSRCYVRGDRGGRSVYQCSSQQVGGVVPVCPRPRIAAERLEDFIEGRFLAAYGTSPHVERREIAGASGESADVTRALADVGRAFAEPGADLADLLARRAALLTRQEELREAATERRVEIVPTGLTVAEAWEAAELDERRTMLRQTYAVLAVKPGRQGSKIIDPARLRIIARPAFAMGQLPAEDYVTGAPAFTVSAEDLAADAAWQAREDAAAAAGGVVWDTYVRGLAGPDDCAEALGAAWAAGPEAWAEYVASVNG